MSSGKIFAFMSTPHTLMVISQGGELLNAVDVTSVDDAKQFLLSEAVNQGHIEKMGSTDFSTLWIDDPAGEPEVIEACRQMERLKSERPDTTVAGEADGVEVHEPEVSNGDESPVVRTLPEPNSDGVYSLHSVGLRFFIGGHSDTEEAGAVDVDKLQIGDVCGIAGVDLFGVSVTDLFEVVATAVNTGEEGSGDFIIQVKKAAVEVALSEPQFQQSVKTKIIEVECPETYSEQEMKRLTRNLQSLKIAACASAAEYRDQIKEAEKALFAAANGRSFTSMECRIENDWEAGIRRFIRPDTGVVAKTEQLPWEERQLNLNLPIAGDLPEQPAEPEHPADVEASGDADTTPAEETEGADDADVDLDDTVTTEDATGHAPDEFYPPSSGPEPEAYASSNEPF